MNRFLQHIRKEYQAYLMVFVAAMMLALTSCPIKREIKGLLNIPVQSSEPLNANAHQLFSQNTPENCINNLIGEAVIPHIISTLVQEQIPTIIFPSTNLNSISSVALFNEKTEIKDFIPKFLSPLPIFLHYCKLII